MNAVRHQLEIMVPVIGARAGSREQSSAELNHESC